MSVHLLGGGALEPTDAPLYAPFVAEATALAHANGRKTPRIAVVSIHPGGPERAEVLVRVLSAAGPIEAQVTSSLGGEALPLAAVTNVDGIVIGGGIVEDVRAGLAPLFDELRGKVGEGVPYLGVSAGAMVAARHALGGGTRIGGRPVCPEDPDDPGPELEVQDGIGLIEPSIDVHVAQRGTLSRLAAAVESGLIGGALGIDERTLLVIDDGRQSVSGSGSVWQVQQGDGGALISTTRAR
ncbi:Type 1 glutamine amidotransferase-like domain-containing protein [Microbacterium stercoris]|uniref:Type 1 glutamine amidotransferase-like domain-containing protein n=1 Tax=Microbacterium stercoris TaxID=2820289 RepID=A0A939QFY3_9MICO|nr:Type 1 glutamine amidotransferase-like domain-containing protein [Microbacterium stercoris]MBO3661929.1 Type 1 glutamine amidotransferase-like domain-containing protein [Microbacterium stercoris]